MIKIRDDKGLMFVKLDGHAEIKMLTAIAGGFIPTKEVASNLDKVTKAYQLTDNWKIEISTGVFLILWVGTYIYFEKE